MTQYSTLNVKLFNSQLDKSGIKNGTEVTLNLSSNVAGDSNNETNFLHKLLLTDIKVRRLHRAFANGSSGSVKFSKTQLSNTEHSEGVLGEIGLALFETKISAGLQGAKNGSKKGAPKLAKNATSYYLNRKISKLNNKLQQVKV